MKKIVFISTLMLLFSTLYAQQKETKWQAAVTRLDAARTVKDYQRLAADFQEIAQTQETQWLP